MAFEENSVVFGGKYIGIWGGNIVVFWANALVFVESKSVFGGKYSGI